MVIDMATRILSNVHNKRFMISIDTEADDQWDTSHGLTTTNSAAIPRFQELCESYGMRPVWLTDYEMALDNDYVSYIRPKEAAGLCEIGMHLHAWTTPPEVPLQRTTDAREFLIEYDTETMDAKIASMTQIIEEQFGSRPVSHRSGRWVMDDRYYDLLVKYGYLIDCSVTPGVNWQGTVGATGMGGSDYSREVILPSMKRESLLEIPVTIRALHFLNLEKADSLYGLARECRNMVTGIHGWLRPYDPTYESIMMRTFRKAAATGDDVLLTLHSSELKPDTNPIFNTEERIEIFYRMMENVLREATSLGYTGCTMREYYQLVCVH